MSQIKTITVSDALDQGYTKCTPLGGGCRLINITDCDFKRKYVVFEKQKVPFFILDDLIKNLLDDYISGQEDFADEDGKLNIILAEMDFRQITETINAAFADGPQYFVPTNIQLIP